MGIIDRPLYIDHILSRLDKDLMLVLVGQRRVGKSYILRLLKQRLESNADSNVVYINKEQKSFGEITTSDHLYDYAKVRLQEDMRNYLLIDEVQDIENYEEALRSLHSEQACQIVVTGSNAYVFSSELSTRLAGRYMEIPIYTLSYREFMRFHGLEDSDKTLLAYLKAGGLPGLMHFDLQDDAQLRDYLQGVYNTVMMKDVLTREKIRNVVFIENLAHFVADNIGKLISSRSISQYMKSQGEKISDPLTISYLRYLCNSLLIREADRYDIHGKKLLEQNCKYYFSDHGLRNMLCGFNLRNSIEKVMENAVYNQLLIRGYKVTVGILRAGEIDFVATRGANRIYVQVTYMLASQETIDREFGNLMAIKDNFPKYVVSMDPVEGGFDDYPGVRHLSLRTFLQTNI